MNRVRSVQISILGMIIMALLSAITFAEEDTAALSLMIGAVEFCPSGTDTWEEATEGMKLAGGDKIRTGDNGMVSILFSNGSLVTLKPNTEFVIQSLSISKDEKDVEYKLQLTRGKLRAILEELGDESTFEIRTPTAVAAVRGTIFYLDVREVSEDELPAGVKERLTTELFVEEGGVIYTNTLSGKYYAVSAGRTSGSYGDGSISEPIEIPPDKQQEWIQGWEDILAAEPYQDPGGGDPDPGDAGGDDNTDDTGGDRQSDQLGQLLKEIHEQDESDIVWREIVDKLLERDEWEREREYLRDQIRDILADNRERRVEGYIEKISDAQMHKVLKDIHGNRVRVEQYVLRPDPYVVELLNVNLRGGVEGGDLTTMEWTTRFNKSLDSLPTGGLKGLPWNDYLHTRQPGKAYINIKSPCREDGIYPEEMWVKFSHKDDGFAEGRKFRVPEWSDKKGRQQIYDRKLIVNNFNGNEQMDYESDQTGPQPDGTYSIASKQSNAGIGEAENNPRGFKYNFASSTGKESYIDAAFYIVSEGGMRQDDYGSLRIDDIWDALRVNMTGSNKNIGDNNLEMRFSSAVSVFQYGPIDLIYIPFRSMEWKDDEPDYSLP